MPQFADMSRPAEMPSAEFEQERAYWKSMPADSCDTYRRTVEEIDKDISAFTFLESAETITQIAATEAKKDAPKNHDVLCGVPFAIKENMAHSGRQLTCASGILQNFTSPYTATAVEQLLQFGAVPIGRTNMDEFAMGSDTTRSIFGRTNNPWDVQRSAGGSSGGAAAAVAAGFVPFALGSDTGGSVRQPAAFCGAWGFKPTYGSVSRYGLVAFASSFDVIGVVAESIDWAEHVFAAMRVRGRDPRDASSFYPDIEPGANVRTVGVYKPADEKELSPQVRDALTRAREWCKECGYDVVDISLPFLEYSPAVYLTIATAEAASNLARFDGVRYGSRGGFAENRLDLIRNARSKGFGEEVMLRVITGGFALRSGFQDQYYIKAQSLRKHMRVQLASMFNNTDVLLVPTFPTPAFLFDDPDMDPFHQKLGDAYSVVANITGVPALNIPAGFTDNLPVGVQAMAPHYAEQRLFNFGKTLSSHAEYKQSPYAIRMAEATGRTPANQIFAGGAT